jgi:hypothetical protein
MSPVTRPGFGYADAVLGTRASRIAAGRARRAVLREVLLEVLREVRLTRILLRVGSFYGGRSRF